VTDLVGAARTVLFQMAAVAVGLVLSSLVLVSIGLSPADSLSTLLRGAFGSKIALVQTTLKAVPLALCGLAVAVPLKMRIWNIGAEGQFLLGAIGATWFALRFPGLPHAGLLTLTIVAGMVAGAAWALVAAIPRALWSVNEIITTLLLNYVAIQLLAYLVTGPLQGKESLNFPISDFLPAGASLPRFGSNLHAGVVFPVGAALVLALVLWTTRWGFEVRLIGASPEAARVVGMSTAKNIIAVLAVGGGLAGLAGMIEVANTFGQLQQGISPGYGYMAIAIAALAGTNLLATLVVAFLFGGFVVGGLALQTESVPQAFVLMLQGIILFCAIGGARLASVRRRRPGRATSPREEGAPSTP
jgi:general nucleoside transport system permease protein